MPSIEFLYNEVASEFENIAATSTGFLSNAVMGRIKSSAAALRTLKTTPGTSHWSIGKEQYQRIETVHSKGECELGDNVAWNVVGTLSFDWEITRVSAGAKASFCIVNASNLLEIRACNADGTIIEDRPPLASWRFEIASGGHPGAVLHSQVNWPSAAEGRLEIPRMPNTLLTPAEALDFMLGELFQRRWPQHCRVTSATWKSTQRRRLMRLLEAQLEEVTRAEDLSPTMQLKAWRPDGLLLRA